jgi:branched-chain amino acid transport system ATP-binding protein
VTLLEVTALHAGYERQPVVWDLSLTVEAGEVVALLGPNGAGKTTTLSTVAGLLPPLSGSIKLEGESIGGMPPQKLARLGVSLVPEDRGLFFELTARENLRLAPRRGGDVIFEDELFRLFRADKWLSRRAGVLSGGEQQMLAVGRAIASSPRVLLLDEMSLGLAPVIVEELLPVVRRVADELGTGVLLVEQHVDLALEVADRVYVLSHGRVVLEGRAAELRGQRALLESSYLGAAGIDSLAAADPH